MINTLEDDHHCFVCGDQNPYGLHITFSLQEGKVSSEFVLQKVYQGYKNIVHGGIISIILDEAMVKAALLQGIPAVSVEIWIRFKNPLIVGEKAFVEATITKKNKKIIETSAEIRKTDGTLIAEGRGKLLKQG
jgi:uncharacterized protein (TIGR00369 family)